MSRGLLDMPKSIVALYVLVSFNSLHAADPLSAYQILQKNCFACHGAARTSGLDLRPAESALAGGAHGAVIVASDPSQSRLYKVLTHEAEPAMPPNGKLSDEDVETIRIWIESGAAYPKLDEKEADAAAKAELAKMEERPITPAERSYWDFRAGKQIPPPK